MGVEEKGTEQQGGRVANTDLQRVCIDRGEGYRSSKLVMDLVVFVEPLVVENPMRVEKGYFRRQRRQCEVKQEATCSWNGMTIVVETDRTDYNVFVSNQSVLVCEYGRERVCVVVVGGG